MVPCSAVQHLGGALVHIVGTFGLLDAVGANGLPESVRRTGNIVEVNPDVI